MELTDIRGISDKKAADFNKLGVFTTEDLVGYFPRGYLDMTRVTPLENCYDNDTVLTYGRIVGRPSVFTSARKLRCVKTVAEQDGRFFNIYWFNQPYVAPKLRVGVDYLFYGRIKHGFGGVTMSNPSFEEVDKNTQLKGIIPVYRLKGGLTQRCVRNAVRAAIPYAVGESAIPSRLLIKYGLGNLKDAYKNVHNPADKESLSRASERIAVEEYFALISAFKIIKGDRSQVRVNQYSCSAEDLRDFTSRFGFEFTDGQKKAVNEIFADMTSPKSMNRLLQGDVGSGKTAVALCAIYVAVKSGYQAVMLAPTEILAEQNYKICKRLFPEYEVDFLSGSTKGKEKTALKKRIKNGDAKIVVGTHAVLTGDVEFYNLSACVCDEQHRFGVEQRSALVAKGIIPDVLVMSATPIPRTLSLIFYGDLDVTEITDKPANRLPVQTNIVRKAKYEGMLGFIEDTVGAGRQVFCVCPKIDGDEEGTIMSVTDVYGELSEKLKGVRTGLLHGRMKDDEKADIMLDFKEHRIDLLVSTTVVEVGIDVPNATVMVIYDAERFGLSQLHQLRGRVGRGGGKSYCFLYSRSEEEKAIERLKVLCEYNDGFKIAEKDFEMRGGGDFMGTRQSGRATDDLGGLVYPASAIFLAKKISDEAFASGVGLDNIRSVAMKKYEKLKSIAMN